MRRLLPALLLLVAMRPAWGHPMPNSSVVLRLHRGRDRRRVDAADRRAGDGLGEAVAQGRRPDGAAIRGGAQGLRPRACPPGGSRRAALDGDGARGDPGRRAGARRAGGADDDPAARRARGPADLPLRCDLPPPDHPHGGGHAGQRLAQWRDRARSRCCWGRCATPTPRSSSTAPGGVGSRDSPPCSASARGTSPRGPTTSCSCSR